jgi:uncharacterized RDD family membrane protein YckC
VSASDGYLGAPIVTGEAVALDLRPAGVATRAVAFVIDICAQIALALIVSLVVFRLAFGGSSAAAQAIVLTLYVLVVLGYPVLFETLTRGRTPGKMAMGLRVVRDDGGPVRFRHALVRGLVGVVIERPGFSFGSIALITMLVSRTGKRVGDMAAGTVVLHERVPVRVAPPPDMPPALAGWASTLDLSGVSDDLALRVRQFLARAHELHPATREGMGASLLAEVVSRTSAPAPSGVPGWAYLAAVLAERRRREMSRVGSVTAAVTAPPVSREPERPRPPEPTRRRTPEPDPLPPPPDSPQPGGGFAPPG